MKIIILFISIIVIWLIVGVADRNYKRARKLEKEGKYKEAVYEYAIAIVTGFLNKKACKDRIKALWSQYGPFDYQDFLQKFKSENDEDSVIHHDIVLQTIQDAVK